MEFDDPLATRRTVYCKMFQRVPQRISEVVEHIFYRLGSRIAQRPYSWLIGSIVIILLCLSGLFRFRQEKNPIKLWVPPDSDFVHDTEWLMSSFGEGVRVQVMVLTADNVLKPQPLIKLNEIIKEVMSVQTPDKEKISWTDICLKVPVISSAPDQAHRIRKRGILEDDFFEEEPAARMNMSVFEPSVHVDTKLYCSILNSFPRACFLMSILDIWDYNSTKIAQDDEKEIIAKINTINISPTLGHQLDYTELLGNVTRDANGRITSATALKTQWFVHVNFSNVDPDTFGNDAGTSDWATEDIMKWELAFLKVLEQNVNKLRSMQDNNDSLALWYEAGRSFGDISSTTLFQDMDKLALGITLTYIYVLSILSNLNWVECRVCLTGFGLLCVGGAFIIAVGVCSLIGIPYGPVHTSLPFMLLGLGVDDLFVMMASWKQVHCQPSNLEKPLHERVGLMLGHAGSAICITSLTDVVAFVIGASTILPSLQSFCIYAAVGVLVTFLLQITFFVAFFTLDCRRIEMKRNGTLPCIVHENYVPTPIDPSRTFSWKFIHQLYSKIVLTIPGKIIILLITIGFASVGVIGSLQLEQWFDPVWFLPEDSYLSQYIKVRNEYFSHRGFDASVFMGDINYETEFTKILALTERLGNQTYIADVEPWPDQFADFVATYYQKDLRTTRIANDDFQYYLSKFLFSRAGGRYQKNFHWYGRLTCGENAPRIQVSSIDFTFERFSGPHQWIPAMDGVKLIAHEAKIDGFITVWSKMFGTWITDKLIAQEVLRNLILALICVMGTTSILIAEPQTCFWILLCVLLTLSNVCGFMFYWGLTIDMVSCIGLELAIGLSVDYAAHVAHAFLNAEGRDRSMRALIAVRHIGAAVAYGAGSTLLALSMLSFSTAYVFRSFFRIFFLVIVFGLWHGLLFLPVVLSTIGPRSLRVEEKPQLSEKAELAEDEANKPLNKETET